MPRRSIWDDEEEQPKPAIPGLQPGFSPAPPKSILDSLRAEPPKKRDRSWDNARSQFVATYRGVPKEIQDKVKEIATELEVKTGEVARALFEYSLESANRSELVFEARPRGVRMTLFGTGDWDQNSQQIVRKWPPPKGAPKRKQEKETERLWKHVVSYHGVPPEVQEQIKAIAEQHTVPVGEVAAMLLKHGLEALSSGRLELTARPKVSSSVSWQGESS